MDQRIIYYNNFASHLLCAYNPNMYHPGLCYRWSDADWFALIDMIADFGFNVFEFWLEPRVFCREALDSETGTELARQLNQVIEHAKSRGVKSEMIVALATVGDEWRTLCPNVEDEWREIQHLWNQWTQRFPGLDLVGIFPGDPGACSRNGCTAETYIDKGVEVAGIIKRNLPHAQVELNTWGPPIFGWGNIRMAPDSKGEFIQADQGSAWAFSRERADRAMQHLLRRLPDFPSETAVSINMGFGPDGNPGGEQDARHWANEIAKTNPILTWDFSLTEGENAVYPHYRFERLFQRRRQEREAAPYQGGICFTMTPLLSQLSLFEAARSFQDPDADPREVAKEFFERIFGGPGRGLVDHYRLFEALTDWGCYETVKMPRPLYHRLMTELVGMLEELKPFVRDDAVFHPSPETYRQDLLFFARLFADLTALTPDYDSLKKAYWDRVYRIYDQLPKHVDPRPHHATDRLISHFAQWR